MNEEDIAELRSLVRDGDSCGGSLVRNYDYYGGGYSLNSIIHKIPFSRDRYMDGGFDWDMVLDSKAPILVFRNACNDVVQYKRDSLPTNKQHILSELKLSPNTNMVEFIESRAIAEGCSNPSDQCNIQISGYASRFQSVVGKRYVTEHEIWLQSGACETPIHVDCGRSVVYIPPCFSDTFKVWAFFPTLTTSFRVGNPVNSMNRMLRNINSCVVIQRPGDVVVVNNLIYYAVLLGYKKLTPESDKWCMIGRNIVVEKSDIHEAHQYATRAVTGMERASRGAWERVLYIFSKIDGRVWIPDNYDAEKELFLKKLRCQDRNYAIASAGANKKHENSKKRKARYELLRASKNK